MKINKVYNENCLDTMARMPDNFVDVVFTSPPYNRKRNDKYKNFNDINDNWYQLNVDVVKELLRVAKGHIFYNLQANYYNRIDVYKLIGMFSEKIVDIHIWEKSNPMPASGMSITNAVEYFIVLGPKALKSNKTYTKNIITTSVNSKMPKDHKAVMKYEVAEHFISLFTEKSDIIYDPFMGIGTTAKAAISANRQWIGSEISKEYCDIIEKRLLPLTHNLFTQND